MEFILSAVIGLGSMGIFRLRKNVAFCKFERIFEWFFI